ncbi:MULTISPECIES: RNB domain-containing ribonuclease [unclassified Bradyrhizobium]
MKFITIDGEHSRDLDDAIRVERKGGGFSVEVAISDVAAAVMIAGETDQAALAQGFSTYRATQTVRQMLPPRLAEDVCSLIAGRPRNTLVVKIDLDQNLDPVTTEVARREILIAKRYSHESVLDAARVDDPLGASLRDAISLAEKLLLKRQAGGAMTFANLERGLVMTEEGSVLHLGRAARAYVLVQELMILTNALLAKRLAERGIPILYRNHRARVTANRESLKQDIILMAQGALNPTTFEARRGLVMERATLGATVEGHYGLNLPVYAWFTSPIRRYADLINQRILLAEIEGTSQPYRLDQIQEIASSLNARYVEEAERTSNGYDTRSMTSAVNMVNQGRTESLKATTFTAAVKALVSGAELGEDFIREAERRLQRGELTSKDLYRLMFMEGALAESARAIAFDHIERRPETAYSVVNYAQSVAGWIVSADEPATDLLADGKYVFEAKIVVAVGDQKYAGTAFGMQKKAAMQRALAAALMSMSDREPPAEWSIRPSAIDKPSKPILEGNPKGELLELWQQKKITQPSFEVTRSGPAHLPEFVCTVSVAMSSGSLRATGKGATRKSAEADAAIAVLAELKKNLKKSAR